MESKKIEFQAEDVAWYSVELRFDKELTIMYEDPSDEPISFSPADLTSESQLKLFRQRFRSVSVPVDDDECLKVENGMRLCCSYQVDEDVRYYDAIVKKVCRSNHVNGKECKCEFHVQWQAGPDSRRVHPTGMGKICWLNPKDPENPALEAFMKRAYALLKKEADGQRKLEEGPPKKSGKVSAVPKRLRVDDDLVRGNIEAKSKVAFDRDNFLLVENLESDLCPEDVVSFIYHHISVICRVYVEPVLLSETSVKGAIFVEKLEDLKKIDDFLHNPAHLITSTSGRPWVISKDWLPACPSLKRFLTKPKDTEKNVVFNEVPEKLKFVRKGTKEHKTAEQLVKLYTAYRDHLDGLDETLVKEEKKIMHGLIT